MSEAARGMDTYPTDGSCQSRQLRISALLREVERQLAAILSADVVGQSRLMGVDETDTVAALSAAPAVHRVAARATSAERPRCSR